MVGGDHLLEDGPVVAQGVLAQQLVRGPFHLPPVDLAVAHGYEAVPEPGHLPVHPGPMAGHPGQPPFDGSLESSLVRLGRPDVECAERASMASMVFVAPLDAYDSTCPG